MTRLFLPPRSAKRSENVAIMEEALRLPRAGTRTNSSHPARPRRVLLVEDNLDVAAMLGSLLRLCGHELLVVHNGPAALAAAGEFAPEIVLLDIGLPMMNGYEVARRLRANPAFEEVLLIAVTGYGQESDRQLAREAGFDYHFVKPVDHDQLAAVLASA